MAFAESVLIAGHTEMTREHGTYMGNKITTQEFSCFFGL